MQAAPSFLGGRPPDGSFLKSQNSSLLFHFPVLKFYCTKETGGIAVNTKLREEGVDFLFKAILTLQTIDECYDFFEDLCTVPELKAMSQRLVVAHMLSEKRVYSDIVSHTGASTATISRVNRSLNYGCDGYEMVFGRMQQQEPTASPAQETQK